MAIQLKRGMMLVQTLTLAMVMTLTVAPTNRADAAPADILVADLDAGGFTGTGPGKVFRLDPAGSRTGEYSVASFVEPSGVAVDPKNGDLLVADSQAFGIPGLFCPEGGPGPNCPGGVIRINAVTGIATTVSSGHSFVEPTGIAFAPNGVDLLVVDQDAFGGGCDDPEGKTGCGGIIKVDPVSGIQTRLVSGPPFWNPTSLAVAPTGDIIVADLDAPASEGPGQIFRVSPDGSTVTPIASGSGPAFQEPSGVAVAPNGQIFVADAEAFGGAGGVIRVNPDGSKTTVSSGNLFLEPTGIAVAPSGVDLLVADQDAFGGPEAGPGGVIKVNSVTGTQTTLAAGAPFVAPSGIAVEPGSPPGPGPGPTPTPPKCQKLQATLSGTDGKDSLKGTPVRDVILGLGGNDTIKALEGHDRVCAGPGKDKVSGGKGKDRLNGEAGNDKLIGGPGADRLVGGKGRDTCIGGPGTDKAIGCEIKIGIP